MYDLHCHILPGVDDGATSIDAALDMARTLVACGFTAVAASPHVGEGPGGDVSNESALAAREILTEALRNHGIPLQLYASAEHMIGPRLFERQSRQSVTPIGGSGKWLLIELPWGGIANIDTVIFRLQTKGFRLLMAHPERDEFLSLDQVKALAQRGVRFQIELGSFVGRYGAGVERRATAICDAGLGHVLATDMHCPDPNTPTWIAQAIEAVCRRYGRQSITRALVDGPKKILENTESELVLPLWEPR